MLLWHQFENDQKTVAILPGGFHIFAPHHLAGYKYLLDKFPTADVYIAATNDTSTRPFTFQQKKFLALQAGIPSKKFIQVKSPYKSEEITSHYDKDNTVLIFGLGQKDADRLGKPIKKDGTLAYFQPYKVSSSSLLQPMSKHAYYVIIPHVSYSIDKQKVDSASKIREMYVNADEVGQQQIIRQLYPGSKQVNKIKDILDNVLSKKNVAESIEDLSKSDIDYVANELRRYNKPLEKISYSELQTAKTQITIAAHHDGKEIGYVIVSPDGDNLRIVYITVVDEWRGTGVGQKLYDHVIQYAKKNGFKKIISDKDLSPDARKAWKRLATRYPVRKQKTPGENSRRTIDLNEEPDFNYSQYNDHEKELSKVKWAISKSALGIEIAVLNGETDIKTLPEFIPWYDENIFGRIKTVTRKLNTILQIHSAQIKPEWKGTGMGQMLYDKLIDVAKKAGYKYLQSDYDRNADSESAWKKLAKRYPVVAVPNYTVIDIDSIPKELGDTKYYQIDLTKIADISLKESPDFNYKQFNDKDADIAKLHWVAEGNAKNSFIIAAFTVPADDAMSPWHNPNLIARISAHPVNYNNEPSAQIYSAFIKDDWKGTGLGQIMYAKMIEKAKELGFTYLYSDSNLNKQSGKAWQRLAQRYPVEYSSGNTWKTTTKLPSPTARKFPYRIKLNNSVTEAIEFKKFILNF